MCFTPDTIYYLRTSMIRTNYGFSLKEIETISARCNQEYYNVLGKNFTLSETKEKANTFIKRFYYVTTNCNITGHFTDLLGLKGGLFMKMLKILMFIFYVLLQNLCVK